MFVGVLIPALVWGLIALLVRRHPETMAGYNTMPRKKREKIDLHRIGRLVSNGMYVGIPFMLLAPLMPTKGLFMTMLVWIPVQRRRNRLLPMFHRMRRYRQTDTRLLRSGVMHLRRTLENCLCTGRFHFPMNMNM